MSRCHVLAFALCVAPLSASAAWPTDHLQYADNLIATITPARNEYGTPSSVSFSNGVPSVFAECGGFVGKVLQNSYSVLDNGLMSALFDDNPHDARSWSSPDSTHFYRAFLSERVVNRPGGTYKLVRRRTAGEIVAGDILVSEYFENDRTGHTMLVRQVYAGPQLVVSKIPGYLTVRRYGVQVIDSSASVHMDKAGTADTRYMKESTSLGLVNDRGAGRGEIYLYAAPDSDVLVGWAWSQNQLLPYQGVDLLPIVTVGKYRPILAGRITGPGL